MMMKRKKKRKKHKGRKNWRVEKPRETNATAVLRCRLQTYLTVTCKNRKYQISASISTCHGR